LIAWIGCGVDVMGALAAGVVGLPLLVAALVAVVLRRARPTLVHRVTLAAVGLTALCALALLPHVGEGPAVMVEWLPGTGPMGLTINASGLYPVLVTTWGGFLVLFASPFIPLHGGEGEGDSVGIRPLSGAVTLLALAAANAAFLADHFLGRYVALEIVALCVALAPLVEARNAAGARLARSNYLLLRLGDAGLLAAILILWAASGTLGIAPALEAGQALDPARLRWVVAGFVLAVWVKLGGWPFHLWSQTGRRLSLASQAWLYATVVPNLGAYLLYRVTPLLAQTGSLQAAALWLGAGGAALGALIALTQEDVRTALVYVGAAQGGLALFIAAAGVKPVVWLGLLALTPVRLLLFLAADAGQSSDSAIRRRAATCFFGLGGLALVAFGLLTTWWAREAGVPLDALFVAEAAVALTAVWAARAMWRLLPSLSPPLVEGKERRACERTGGPWAQWVVVGLLGGGVLAGGLTFEPLVRYLAAATHLTLPALPAFPALLRYAATAPALLAVFVLSLAAWRLQRRSGQRLPIAVGPAEEAYDLEEGLAQAARALRAVVEVGIAERIVALVVQAVVNGARAAWAVEHKGLEGLTSLTARAIMDGALVAHRTVEQQGLDGLLRHGVRSVLTLSRVLQRWHTGRLRRNLLWVPIVLALAVLALVLYGW